jgi:hypothetical protein
MTRIAKVEFEFEYPDEMSDEEINDRRISRCGASTRS